MRIIKPSFKILDPIDGSQILKKIEYIGRKAHKSEDRITITTDESAKKFIKMLMERGHLSVIEHVNISVEIICDRGVSHELVRHRLASYTQESTRYCNYSQGKFGSEITVILPLWFYDCFNVEEQKITAVGELNEAFLIWHRSCALAEHAYFDLLNYGLKTEQTRAVLPTCLKTEIAVTCNLREWRHIFTMRCAKAAHPQMRQIMIPLLHEFQTQIPVIFDDIIINE